MIIEERNTVINDAWQGLLIVTSDKPIPDYPNNIITQSNDYYETVYYTNGVFRSYKEDEQFINHYLILSKEVKEKVTAKLQSEIEQMQTVILGLMDAMSEK